MDNKLLAIGFLSALLVTGCGGGGGGGGSAPANQLPTADAGVDQTVNEGTTVDLTGSGTDPDGSITGYQWTQTSGPSVSISGADTANASFFAPFVFSAQTVTLQLTVTDNAGGQASDTVNVQITDQSSNLPSNQVNTQQGILEGIVENGLRIFKGVRYAAPPTGSLRFKPPQEPAFVGGVTQATLEGPPCIQFVGTLLTGGVLGQEDCLRLNVWAPDDDQIHPVMVYLHPGSANTALMDGADLARETGSVIVTLHARRYVMGYLAIQELADESPNQSAGNYGVLDVIAALRWVNNNIVEFGGNPGSLMLAGNSSGGGLVCNVFSAPSANGLFESAAVQSGNCAQVIQMTDISEAQRTLLETTNCDTAADKLQCLRDFDAGDLVVTAQASGAPFLAAVDGVVIASNPFDALRDQVAGDFPLITGSTEDESRNLTLTPIADDAAYRDFLAANFPSPLDEQLYNLYPTADYPSANDAFHALYSDIIGCGAQLLADAGSTNREVYVYLLTRGVYLNDVAGNADDVVHLFNTFDKLDPPVVPDAAAEDITSAMRSGWTGLAGDPQLEPFIQAGASGNFGWPSYSPDNVQVLELGDPVKVVNQYRGGRCTALNDLLTTP